MPDELRRGEPTAVPSSVELPEGRQLAVTWSIPDRFGGMTSAMLHRSRAFVRLAGRDVDVVTFDTRPDYASVRERLAAAGEIVPGIRLHNLYDDLRAGWTGELPSQAPTQPPEPAANARLEPVDHDRTIMTTAPDGAELRMHELVDGGEVVEHLRVDGSLAVRVERADGSNRIIAYAPDGRATRVWTSAWSCYADWLDHVIGGEPAFAIVDSKTIARFMAEYRRPNVTSVHVVHSSHLEGPDRPFGPLRQSREPVLRRLERFDAVVFLTERQRADAVALLSDPGNMAVVPNGLDLHADAAGAAATGGGTDDPDNGRDPLSGVVLASLTPRKRIDHAIDIVAACHEGGVPVTLTVYGDGPDAAALVDRTVAAGLGQAVTFAGHRTDAANAFGEASWTLLTSEFEGAPLVLAEAMAGGCIPVAYDIAYGPADMIDDGVTGFLVPDGDRAAAAAAITRLTAMPADERSRMRRAAQLAATRYDDPTVVAEWARVLRTAAARHVRPAPPIDATLDRLRLRYRRGRLRVTARLSGVPRGARIAISLRRPKSTAFVQTRMRAPNGRITWRLDTERSRVVGGRHPLVCVVAVELDNSRQEFAAVRATPDRRSPARRIAQRLARIVRPAVSDRATSTAARR
jgi:poly(glycerol-phosphate) alpha-glucosyltransferase